MTEQQLAERLDRIRTDIDTLKQRADALEQRQVGGVDLTALVQSGSETGSAAKNAAEATGFAS